MRAITRSKHTGPHRIRDVATGATVAVMAFGALLIPAHGATYAMWAEQRLVSAETTVGQTITVGDWTIDEDAWELALDSGGTWTVNGAPVTVTPGEPVDLHEGDTLVGTFPVALADANPVLSGDHLRAEIHAAPLWVGAVSCVTPQVTVADAPVGGAWPLTVTIGYSEACGTGTISVDLGRFTATVVQVPEEPTTAP